jgi:hypothetical protein
MVVVGGIYSPNHYSSRWMGLLSTSAPDTALFIVRCLPRQLIVRIRSSWPLNSPVLVAHQTVRCNLTSLTVFDLLTLQTVAVDRCSWAHQTVRWFLAEKCCVFSRAVNSSDAPAWALDIVRCTAGWYNLDLPHTYRIGPRVIFLVYVYELYTTEKKYQLGKLVSP